MEFIEQAGELNEFKNYPQLLERCKHIGYEVSKVVFRGYHAAPKLQNMHDDAIAMRTKLKLEVTSSEIYDQSLVVYSLIISIIIISVMYCVIY